MEGSEVGFPAIIGIEGFLGVVEAVVDEEGHLGREVAGSDVLAVAVAFWAVCCAGDRDELVWFRFDLVRSMNGYLHVVTVDTSFRDFLGSVCEAAVPAQGIRGMVLSVVVVVTEDCVDVGLVCDCSTSRIARSA